MRHTIIVFLKEQVPELYENSEVLVKPEQELTEQEKSTRKQLFEVFTEKPVHTFLPDKPVKQAYFFAPRFNDCQFFYLVF